jgi:hypothetical protein|tara:strand:- start:1414 stop:1605 length:192 start_codon:yes stop_codon:yes gene_type:complete
MSTQDIIANKDQIRGNEAAESIRRLTASGLALMIENLCKDNMGSNLVAGLQAELQDLTYRSGV